MPTPSRERLKHEKKLQELIPFFPDYVGEYFRDKKRASYSPSTLYGYSGDFNLFFSWLIREKIVECEEIKDIPYDCLADLKKKQVEYFIDYLNDEPYEFRKGVYKKRSKARVLRTINALKSLFNYLTTETENDEGECYFDRNVFKKIKTHKKKESMNSRARKINSVLLERKDINNFLDYLRFEYETTLSPRQKSLYLRDKERDIALISVAFGTGIRVTELSNLLMNSIDFKKRQLDVTRKGEKDDTVLILPSALEDLRYYLEIRESRYKPSINEQYVFLTRYNGGASPISTRTIQTIVNKYTKAFNEDGKALTPHKLRHSFASEWLRSGGNLVLLRDQLGHNSIETTTLYTNLSNEDAQKVLDEMEQNNE